MRDFKITRKEGEMYCAIVTDSYGTKYNNWFESAQEANEWIYYIWENEDNLNHVSSDELLSNAIKNCVELDKKNNNLRDIL